VDKDGEDRADVMIKDIQPHEGDKSIITALLDTPHGFETGDRVTFSEVVGLQPKPDQSING